MGVSCVIQWSYPEGLNPSQALEDLQRKLEVLGGNPLTNWVVDCDMLQSTPAMSGPTTKTVQLIHSSEYPRTTFAIMDSFTCLVADNSLDSIFAHLKPFYTSRKALKMEAKGYRCEVKNYVVKFASVTYGSSSKGIVVEVEDAEDSNISTAWNSLTDFTRSLLQTPDPIQMPSHVEKSIDGHYTPADSVVQYALIFSQLRKPISTPLKP